MDVKPGWTTTEFWTTLLTQVIALAVAVAPLFGHPIEAGTLGPLVPASAVLAAAIATALYSHARASVKAASVHAGRHAAPPEG